MPVIDFITVSRTPQRVQLLQQSLGLSLGTIVPHQLIVIDGNSHDLFTGYNAGAAKATADVLAFIHDDVQLLGNALTFGRPLQLLQDPSIGFIGAAGSRILDTTGAWWGGNLTRQQTFANCRGMVLHAAQNEFGIHALVWPGGSAEFGQVLVVDGVFLMCHRRTFDRLGGFDAATFKGFHFYDVDITFRAHQQGLKNLVAPIPMLHASTGNYGPEWEASRRVFVEKHKRALPASL
jgi:GT2 family glycosyltransferase